MLILYAYDANTILAEPTKSRSDINIFRAYGALYETLETAGHATCLTIMDNKASKELK